jgi:protein deglycase
MKRILLLLADDYEIFEVSAFIDVIGWNLVDGEHPTELYSCRLKKELKSSFGQRFVVDYLIDVINVTDFDA